MVNFTLTGLNSDVGLTQKATFETSYSAPTISTYDFIMEFNVSKTMLNQVFYIETSDPTLDGDLPGEEANDVLYFTDYSKWNQLINDSTIKFSLGNITSSYTGGVNDLSTYKTTLQDNNYAGNTTYITKKIGPAFLAKQITGGYNNSDIFSNETELVTQYDTLDNDITSQIESKLIAAGDLTAGTKLDNSSTGVSNISREIFLKLVNTNVAADKAKLLSIFTTSNHDAPVKLAVFDENDTLEFTVTYNVNAISVAGGGGLIAIDSSDNALGSNPITNQVFKVILHPT
jgi:hypothetical protein